MIFGESYGVMMFDKFHNKEFLDLSHPIISEPACSPQTLNIVPEVSFQEANENNLIFITTRLDNLLMNVSTHIDFPGHLSLSQGESYLSVGKYPLERFIGLTAVIDVSQKLDPIRDCFSNSGYLHINYKEGDTLLAFLKSLDDLAILESDVEQALLGMNLDLADLQGVIFYTGLSDYWQYKQFESWEYIYFFGPFLDQKLCQMLIRQGISFVGIDCFQLDHPIINFQGQELPLMLNSRCRCYVQDKLKDISSISNHKILLQKDVLIYENLNCPSILRNSVTEFFGVPWNFQLEGMNNNALVRPFVRQVRIKNNPSD